MLQRFVIGGEFDVSYGISGNRYQISGGKRNPGGTQERSGTQEHGQEWLCHREELGGTQERARHAMPLRETKCGSWVHQAGDHVVDGDYADGVIVVVEDGEHAKIV